MNNIINKVIVVAILSMVSFTQLMAQTPNKAEKIVENTINQLKEYDAMKIIFNYNMKNETEQIDESMKGEILSKKEKFRLKIAGQEIYNNGVKQWTYLPENDEVQVNNVIKDEDESESLNPLQLLDDFKEKFTLSLENEKAKNLVTVNLTPIDQNGGGQIMKVVINTLKNEPVSFSLSDEVGNVFTYQLLELIPNIAIDESDFTFNITLHPDVEVIDMR